jgi:hypothetical protein
VNIGIATYATERYTYALPNFGRRICASIHHSKIKKGKFIFIGDNSEKIKQSALLYIGELLPKNWEFIFIPLDLSDKDLKNYKEHAQLLIAQMQSYAFSEARKLNLDFLWSVESDVLVSANSLSVSLDILKFDSGYYDVAMCSYPSQGGGAFLGGRGDHTNHIYEDYLPEEKDIPEDVIKEYGELIKKFEEKPQEVTKEDVEKRREFDEKLKEYPPKGNVFEANAKKWRRRGWMEYAYPAIGKGAIVPTDWVGLGCTMMSRKALSYAHFDGYEGRGTQDLYMGYTFWYPNDIKMCVTTHSICDHVIRQRGEGEEQLWEDFIHAQAYHEHDGECKGHLRQNHIPFYNHIAGELPKEKKENINNKEKEI